MRLTEHAKELLAAIRMVTETAAKAMFGTWPEREDETDLCWELTTMEQCADNLAFHKSKWAKSWGWGNARLVSSIAGEAASAVLLAAPPFTVRLRKTSEKLNILQANWTLVIFTETDHVVLPPDTMDAQGRSVPFYKDPQHRRGDGCCLLP